MWKIVQFAFIFTAFGLAGCASLGIGMSAEERVSKRAQERLDALMRGDFDSAYEFVSPGQRELTTRQDHAARYAGIVNWTGAAVQGVSCDNEDRCEVGVEVDYRMPRIGAENTRYLNEVWIQVDEGWYFYYN